MIDMSALLDLLEKSGEHQKVINWKKRFEWIDGRREIEPEEIRSYCICILGTQVCRYLKRDMIGHQDDWYLHDLETFWTRNPLEVLEFETLEQAGKVLVRIPKELFKTSIIVPLTKSYLLPA